MTDVTLGNLMAEVQKIEASQKKGQLWEILLRSMVGVLSVAAVPAATHIVTLGNRVSVIEANRFTLQNAIEMERRIIDRPMPKWVQEQFLRMSGDMAEVKSELREIRKELKK